MGTWASRVGASEFMPLEAHAISWQNMFLARARALSGVGSNFSSLLVLSSFPCGCCKRRDPDKGLILDSYTHLRHQMMFTLLTLDPFSYEL